MWTPGQGGMGQGLGLSPTSNPPTVSSAIGRGNLKGARYKWQAETLQPNTCIAHNLQTLTRGHMYKDVYK